MEWWRLDIVKCTEMLILNSFNFSELKPPVYLQFPRTWLPGLAGSKFPLVVDFDSLLHIIIS